MSKTPEEMAEDYVQLAIRPHMPDKDGECYVRNYDVWSSLPNGGRIQMIFTGPPIKDAFLAGYKAAMELAEWQMKVLNNLNELIKESEEE